MRILVACEYSGIVRDAFKLKGHDAMSCDLIDTDISGNHYKGDVFDIINDGWDMMIGHPPCTYLTVTGNKWFKPEYKDRFPKRQEQRDQAIEFFMKLANAPIKRICLENPVGVMSSLWRKPDQIIQPWYFGDKDVKKTCLWLKNLPPLKYSLNEDLFGIGTAVKPQYKIYKSSTHKSGFSKYPMAWTNTPNAKEWSKFFPQVARAMADQWGGVK